MEEEMRELKEHKAYYNMLHFVSEAQQGIPKFCPCGSLTKEIVDEEDSKILFRFEHAWRELRHDMKWRVTCLEKDKRKAVDGQGPEPEPEADAEPEERPIGVKAAKAGKRKKTSKEEELSKLEGVMEIKKQISNQNLLERLLAKAEPLSDLEAALRDKLIADLLS